MLSHSVFFCLFFILLSENFFEDFIILNMFRCAVNRKLDKAKRMKIISDNRFSSRCSSLRWIAERSAAEGSKDNRFIAIN